MSERCVACDEPMSDRYTSESAHQWHEPGCPFRDPEYNAAGYCDCRGYVHSHCCRCELDHEVLP